MAARAPEAVVAPVPPLVRARVPLKVTAPVVAPEGVRPVVPPLNEDTPEATVVHDKAPDPLVESN
jgi:hypothetical protein